jgi:hypothetical protein
MSNIARMMQRATAGAGGDPLDITDVFSTYLYDGNGSTQTITNGIDLDGEGGLVWIKCRDSGQEHNLYDTERGIYKFLQSQSYAVEDSNSGKGLTAFNSNGFSLDVGNESGSSFNNGSFEYVSWTFRKAPKFFDIVEYTGNGVAGRTIPHNLGCTVGAMFIKRTNVEDNWPCFHRSLGGGKVISINVTDQALNASAYWNDTAPTDSVFTLGSDNATNNSGDTYIAYIFAHNNNDGGFGPDGDQDIIKCGNFTTQSSAFEVDLGFEPQWIMLKLASAGSWYMYDVMRGIAYGEDNQSTLYANQSYSEFQVSSDDFINPTPTGFKINQNMINQAFGNNQNVIYMAIRRGTLTTPEDATEVFAMDNSRSTQANANGVVYYAGFPIDFSLFSGSRSGGGNKDIRSRLTGEGRMFANSTNAETVVGNPIWDTMYGWKHVTSTGTLSTDVVTYMWKRAPGFFDAVAFTGTGSARTVSHNLGVAPEMMWIKNRDDDETLVVYHTGTGNDGYMVLSSSGSRIAESSIFQSTTPTGSVFSVGADVSLSSKDYIAYLFSTLAGVSKVGSVSHTSGSGTNVDCGFAAGARFIILKRYDATSDWWFFDTVRGIAVGNDARLILNNVNAETSTDQIDPYSAGFTIDSNRATGDYIFYAIA